MTKVQLKGVSKIFGMRAAVTNLDLDIPTGELIALLGPSGCGKTTSLRMIAGLEHPSSGQIHFNGQDITHVPPQNRNVGMVFQRFALFPHMNVEKNITFGLRMRHLSQYEINARLDRMLDIVKLKDVRLHFPSQLSGGQMQRVAIARTLIVEPKILMMDEPLTSLDSNLRADMRSFIRNLQKELNMTMIFVTHDQSEAMELADKIAIMFNGRIAQYDRPMTLYQHPKSLEVAKFLGANNLFDAKIISSDRVKTQFASLKIDQELLGQRQNIQHIMIRAEAIEMNTRRDEHAVNCLEGVIETREFFGPNVRYGVKISDHLIEVVEPSRRLLEVGQIVWLTFGREHICLI